MWQNVHPTRKYFAGSVRSDAVKHGLNAENVSLADDRYVRCRQCGFMCHLDRDMRARKGDVGGEGVTGVVIDAQQGWTDFWGNIHWGGQVVDPTVTSGCPFCGSYLWA